MGKHAGPSQRAKYYFKSQKVSQSIQQGERVESHQDRARRSDQANHRGDQQEASLRQLVTHQRRGPG